MAPSGLSFRNSGAFCSPLVRSTLCTLCSSPHSASATAARKPFAVPHMYRSIMAIPSSAWLEDESPFSHERVPWEAPARRSIDHRVRRKRQEFDVVAGRQALEEFRALLVLACAPGFLAERRAHLGQLLGKQRAKQFDGYFAAVGEHALA